MHKFSKDFHTLAFTFKESEKILLFAHSRPDGDTIGSVLALREYALHLGKKVDIACFDPFPDYLDSFSKNYFFHPDNLNLQEYNLIVACDGVDRYFHKIQNLFHENQVIALLDHHLDMVMKGDINIIDSAYSSVCEIIYDFFEYIHFPLSREISTFLLLGILSDTGVFQHSNTTARVMEIGSILVKNGAPLSKIIRATFTNKNISTLKLWGKAFEKAKINSTNGMIVSVITENDLKECNAGIEDVAQVSSILNTVPGTKFALILSERGNGIIKGSLRSDEYKNVDVSKIAAQFGGGGHKLASGFEITGKIKETATGWRIE